MGSQYHRFAMPTASINDDPLYCIKVNGEYRTALLGMLQVFEWLARWESGVDAGKLDKEASLLYQAIVNAPICQGEMMLRQNPSDVCQLQQSFDGGETWTLAFDYGLCLPDWAKGVLDGINLLRDNLWSNQTPTQINPNAPTDTWVHTSGDTQAESELRLQALCYAVRKVVDIAFDQMVAAYNQDMTLINAAEVTLGILAALTAFEGVTAWIAFGAAMGIASLEAAQIMVAQDVAILNTEANRAAVACELMQALQARPVSAFALCTALSDAGTVCFSADVQRALILMRATLENDEQCQSLYTGFVDALGNAHLAYKAGLLNASCTCPASAWSYCLPLDKWYEFSFRIDVTYTAFGNEVAYGLCGDSVGDNVGVPTWETGLAALQPNHGLGRKFTMYVPVSTTVTEVHVVFSGHPNYTHRMKVNDFDAANLNATGLTISGEELIFELESSINAPFLGQVLTVQFIGTGVPLFGTCSNCP